MKEWQQRPLENIYAVVFMDAIHYNVRCEGRIVKKAVYIAIGINMDGKKDVFGMYVDENESAKYWLSILNGLKNRGVEDNLHRRTHGIPRSNIDGISESRDTTMHNTSDKKQHKIRVLQGHKSYDLRFETSLRSCG